MTLTKIAFPYAGGSKYSLQILSNHIDDFKTYDYPGRGTRIKEDLIYDIDLLVDNLFQTLKHEIDFVKDYVIYGHSMGALIGYLICHKIEELKLRRPLKLIVSGKKPPFKTMKKKYTHLPDNHFWEEIIKLGGIQEEIQQQPELIEFYSPILKADFTAIENYQYVKRNKLSIPIDVFYGSEEAVHEDMQGWIDETTEQVTITQLQGNHFFIFNHVDFFSKYFNNMSKTKYQSSC